MVGGITDVDMAEAITRLESAKLAVQASAQVFAPAELVAAERAEVGRFGGTPRRPMGRASAASRCG
jgi:hypothetical protein